MSKYDQEAIELHEKNRGKFELAPKVGLSNRHDLSLAYSPGVGAICKEVARDKSRMYDLCPKGNLALIVSDGTANLGFGDLGAAAVFPVLEGKALLFKQFGGVDVMPLTVNEHDVDKFVEIIVAISDPFGAINLEDIAAPRCFEILEKLQERLDIPVFHDDQHGTAIVTLAGLINAMKVTGRDKDMRIVLNGAGAAGMAITRLLLDYGFTNLVMLDSRGMLYEGRENMNPYKQEIAKRTNRDKLAGGLAEAMVGADCFVGVSKAGLVSQEMVQSMADDPIIFAMANPDPEITEEDARAVGVRMMATGRSDSPNQINNILAFPGLFRGILDARAPQFTNEMFVKAAEALADHVENPSPEKFIPNPFDEGVAECVAEAVKRLA